MNIIPKLTSITINLNDKKKSKKYYNWLWFRFGLSCKRDKYYSVRDNILNFKNIVPKGTIIEMEYNTKNET